MVNLYIAAILLIGAVFFGIRAADDFGWIYTPKIPFIFGDFSKKVQSYSNGGNGGSVKIDGQNVGTAIGGKGGGGGPGGAGGAGGDVDIEGNNEGFALGGEGGEAGQVDRGGKGGRGPLEVIKEDYPEEWARISTTFGLTAEDAMKYGRGGDGASSN